MLIKVTIKNFGSIKEEQTIKFNKDVTSLIGKNESGKSTILKAIEKLNDGKITESDKNVLLRDRQTYIEGTFKIEKAEIEKINATQKENTNYGFYCFPEEYDCLYFTKKVDDTSKFYYGLYYLSEDSKGNKTVENSLNMYFIEKIRKIIIDLIKDEKDESFKILAKDIIKLNEDEIKNRLKELNITDEPLKEQIDLIISEISKNEWINLLPKYKFISFSSFKDVLKDNVLFADLSNNKQAQNILKIANIDMDRLTKAFETSDEVTLDDMQTEYLEVVSKKFKEIFQQTDENFKLKVRFGTNKRDIIFLTQDKTSESKSINLSQRSDGFKWYLSLYLTLFDYLENIDDCVYILLLDEPNLYLHPGAQYNLLFNVFYKEFSNVQIIYTTHSPYMIDINNSFSIRIIEKREETVIFNSTREYALCKNNKLKDVDTMTPLLTALDLSISNDLIFDIKDKLFVVEGIQDVYVLRAFINKLNYSSKLKNIKFISGTSAEKVPFMYSYLFGMGYNVFTLVDNDNSGINANKTIVDDSDNIEFYDKLLTYDIINDEQKGKFLLEDLFSTEDLEKYLPQKNTIYYKRLFDNYSQYDFTKETIENFKKLFEKLLKVK